MTTLNAKVITYGCSKVLIITTKLTLLKNMLQGEAEEIDRPIMKIVDLKLISYSN